MRIACIVPRYGTEIVSGVAHHGRLIAEQLAERHMVDVLTSCARDAATWRNEYPEGSDRLRGVTVRRFATSRTRDAREADRGSSSKGPGRLDSSSFWSGITRTTTC